MKLAGTKPRSRITTAAYNLSQKIRLYDLDNAYPQMMLRAISNSSTAKSCLDIYHKFIKGNGFSDPSLSVLKANKRDTYTQLHNKLSRDFSIFSGFVCHVGYNMLLEPFYTHTPFEHCRWEVDGDKMPTGRIAVHPDWTKESGRKFNQADIIYLPPFNPDKAQVFSEIEACGGFDNYKGQAFYACEEPVGVYPLAHADPVCTYMETEESVSTGMFRNARFNFLPGGIIVVKKKTQFNEQGEPIEGEGSAFESAQNFQGDENALKMLVVEIENDEDKPEFMAFPSVNLDKQYELTVKTAEEKIGKFYQIPPVLRGSSSSGTFATDEIINAYDYYNSNTESERTTIEEYYAQLFAATGKKFTIQPKQYKSTPKPATA